MKLKEKIRACIFFAPGTNCEKETYFALSKTGFHAEIIPIKEILENKEKLLDYQFLVIPGGFSYGDDIKSGKILSLIIRFHLFDMFKKFHKQGNIILGICNGFQVLLRAGILPFFDGKQWASLEINDTGKFEDRWIYLKKENSSIFTKYIAEVSPMPVAHAEGKFIAQPSVLKKLEKESLIAFLYCDRKGNPSSKYPVNPNGSYKNIAGITTKDGRVLGMMPHPERAFEHFNFPEGAEINGETPGQLFFKGIFKYLQEKKQFMV